jgi:hypothetical protein
MESKSVDVEWTVPPPEMCLPEGKRKLKSLVRSVAAGFRVYGTSASRDPKLGGKVEEGGRDGAGQSDEVSVGAGTGAGGERSGVSSGECVQGSVEAGVEREGKKEGELKGADARVPAVASVANDLAAGVSDDAAERLVVVEEKNVLEEHVPEGDSLSGEESYVHGTNSGGFAAAVDDEIGKSIGAQSAEFDVFNVVVSPDDTSRHDLMRDDNIHGASRDDMEGTATQELAEIERMDGALPVSTAVTLGHPGRRYSLERNEEDDREDVFVAQVTIK